MPWVDENGLLPGRGVPGLGAGRGAAVGEADAAGARGSSAAGAGSCAAGAAGSSGASARSGADSTDGAAAGRAPEVTVVAGASSVTTAAAAGCSVSAAAAFLAGAFLAAFLAALASAAFIQASPCSSSRRRATGGSTVEEADLTNSPMSLSAARTSLLGTPNSFASSWTLALATILLLGRSDPRRVQTVRCWACSSHESHRDVMSRCSTLFVGLLSRHRRSPAPRMRTGGVSRSRPAARWCRADPLGAGPAGTHDDARLTRDTRAWGARARPGPLFFPLRRVRRIGWIRHRRRRHAGGQTLSRVHGSPHRCGQG